MFMGKKPTYKELVYKTKQLEREVLEYVRREQDFNTERNLVENLHVRRTISLMKINAELSKEINELERIYKEEREYVFNRLREYIKE